MKEGRIAEEKGKLTILRQVQCEKRRAGCLRNSPASEGEGGGLSARGKEENFKKKENEAPCTKEGGSASGGGGGGGGGGVRESEPTEGPERSARASKKGGLVGFST